MYLQLAQWNFSMKNITPWWPVAALLCCHWWGNGVRQRDGFIFVFLLLKWGFSLRKDLNTRLKEHLENDDSGAICEIVFSSLSQRCVAITVKFNPSGSCVLVAVCFNNRLPWVSNENVFSTTVRGENCFNSATENPQQVSMVSRGWGTQVWYTMC